MLHIEKFLSKTKIVIDESEDTRKEISQILFQTIKLNISLKKISLIGTRIKIKTSPLEKLHIVLNKQKILKEISKHKTLSSKITDIL